WRSSASRPDEASRSHAEFCRVRRGWHAAVFMDKSPPLPIVWPPGAVWVQQSAMVDIAAAPQRSKVDASWRTLVLISTAHWVSHFYILVLPMLFPFLKAQLGVSYFA